MLEHLIHILGTLVAVIGAYLLSRPRTGKAIVWAQNLIEPWFDYFILVFCIAVILFHVIALAAN